MARILLFEICLGFLRGCEDAHHRVVAMVGAVYQLRLTVWFCLVLEDVLLN